MASKSLTRRQFVTGGAVAVGLGVKAAPAAYSKAEKKVEDDPKRPFAPLLFRGLPISFPFPLNTSNPPSEIRLPLSFNGPAWWYDEQYWQSTFIEMESQGLNAIAFEHHHPYPALADLPQYPEARCLDSATLARSQSAFRTILAAAKHHHVKTYLFTWNIWVPPGFATAHSLPMAGADTALTRAYNRAIVAEIYRSFPDLTGLITCAAENPPGCAGFVKEAIVGGLLDSGRKPELILRVWCSYPWEAQLIMGSYPGVRLMHNLQYEQYFLPMADPRLGRYGKVCGNMPMIALGGPKSALDEMFWGDPKWAYETVRSLCRENGNGLFIEANCAESWLARDAFAEYIGRPNQPYSQKEWAARVGKHYNCPDQGDVLLTTMQNASAIIPHFIRLVHSQSDHFRPQLGLPLAYYLYMPTISTYIFENVQQTDAEGYLTPDKGLCWPNPNWGVKVASVREYVAGKVRPGAITPLDIASQLYEDGIRALSGIQRIKASNGKTIEGRLNRLLLLMELNAILGLHYAAKIQAAIEWERFHRGDDLASGNCLRYLADSVKEWERLVPVADQVYTEPIPYYRSDLFFAPPWLQNQIWGSYRLTRAHWRDHLEPFRQELGIIRASVSLGPKNSYLPLWDTLLATPVHKLEPILSDGFETHSGDNWIPGAGAGWTRRPTHVIEGKGAVLLDSRTLIGKEHSMLLWKPSRNGLRLAGACQLTFLYRVIDPGRGVEDPFTIAAYHAESSGLQHRFQYRNWGGPAGSLGRQTVAFEGPAESALELVFSIRGQAAVVIDSFQVGRIRTLHAGPTITYNNGWAPAFGDRL